MARFLRTLLAGTVVAALVAAVWAGTPAPRWEDKSKAPSNTSPAVKSLSAEEERTLRAAVYDRDIAVGVPRDGRWAFLEILHIPDSVCAVYREKPVPTLTLLRDIVRGGNPKDAMLAAGYALALVKGPSAGVVCVRGPRKLFDRVDKAWKITPRQHWVRWIDKLISQQGKP
jgi:hypothetical protein